MGVGEPLPEVQPFTPQYIEAGEPGYPEPLIAVEDLPPVPGPGEPIPVTVHEPEIAKTTFVIPLLPLPFGIPQYGTLTIDPEEEKVTTGTELFGVGEPEPGEILQPVPLLLKPDITLYGEGVTPGEIETHEGVVKRLEEAAPIQATIPGFPDIFGGLGDLFKGLGAGALVVGVVVVGYLLLRRKK